MPVVASRAPTSMLALSLFSTLHLGIAMVAAFMAALHLLMWGVVRTERANLWVGLSFAGFALLDAAIAGSSVASDGALGAVSVWLLLTVPTALLLPLCLLRTVWAVLDLPVGKTRRTIMWVTLLLVLPEAANVVRLVVIGHPATASWEASRYDFLWAAVPYHLSLTLVGVVYLVEAIRCLRSMRALAIVTLIAMVPALTVTMREALLLSGVTQGPTWIGLVGLPLTLFASAAMVARYVKVVRDATRGSAAVEQNYRRVYQLGRGGMGEVWLGVRVGAGGFRRFVVLKRIRLDGASDEAMARFVSEARVAARLHHPNIVSVHDFGRTGDDEGHTGWFIVMEYLAGASLYDVLHRAYEEQAAIPPEVIIAVGEQVLRGLDCAHTHGVLHRDISPDNVIVTFDGEVKLLDFGIAKETRNPDMPALTGPAISLPNAYETVPGGVAGKRRYLAPERLIGEPAVAESDLYSLSLVLLELFGVELPETGADIAGGPAPLRESGLRAPAGLDPLLSKALSPNPALRFRSATAMAAELRAVASGLPRADLRGWIRELCAPRYEVAKKLASLDKPTAEAIEAIFVEPPNPTVEVSPARPKVDEEFAHDLRDGMPAVGELHTPVGPTRQRAAPRTDPIVPAPVSDGTPPRARPPAPTQPSEPPPERVATDVSTPAPTDEAAAPEGLRRPAPPSRKAKTETSGPQREIPGLAGPRGRSKTVVERS